MQRFLHLRFTDPKVHFGKVAEPFKKKRSNKLSKLALTIVIVTKMSKKPIHPYEMFKQIQLTLHITFTDLLGIHGSHG